MGFRPIDASQGHIIHRKITQDEEEQDLTLKITKNLRNSENQIVLGAAGSGKSSICMSVAYEWYDNSYGEVFYRRSGCRPFGSLASLEKEIEKADGHVLVVVEDALREEVNAIFQLMNNMVRKSSDVAFLFDSRYNEYRNLDPAPIGAGVSNEMRQARDDLNPIDVPKIDKKECERIVEEFKNLSNRSYNISSEEVYPFIKENGLGGDMFQLAYHLISNPDGMTGLENDVIDKIEVLERHRHDSSVGEQLSKSNPRLVEQLGFAINLINAAPGMRLRREHLHILVHFVYGPDKVQTVEELLSGPLNEWLVYTDENGDLQTMHELWSFLYLKHLIAGDEDSSREPLLTPRVAHQRFADIVESIEQVFGDEDAIEDLRFWSQDPVLLDLVQDDPVQTAEWTIKALYKTVSRWPILTPIFEPSGASTIDFDVLDFLPGSLQGEVDVSLGHGYRKRGKFTEAEDKFGIELDEIRDSPQDDLLFDKAYGSCSVYLSNGEFDKAEEYATRVLDSLDRENDAEEYARFEAILGNVEWKRAEFEEAKIYYKSALDTFREAEISYAEAEVLNELGEVYRLTGEIDKAENHYQRSLQIKRDYDYREGIITSLNGLGQIARAKGDVEKAKGYYQRCLELSEEIGHKDIKATVLNNLGLIHRLSGNLDLAESHHEQSLEHRESIGDREGIAESIGNLGTVALGKGRLDEAEKKIGDSIEILEELGDSNGVAHRLNDLGSVHKKKGDYQEAKELYSECLEVSRETGNKDLIAESLNNLGQLRVLIEKPDQAVPLLEKAVNLYEELGNNNGEVSALNNLGSAFQRKENLSKAKSYYDRAFEISEENGLMRKEAGCRHNLGTIALERGDYDEAKNQLEQAMKMNEKMNDKPNLASCLFNLGRLELQRGNDIAKAREYLNDALRMFKQVDDLRSQALCFQQLSVAEYRCGNMDEALKYRRQSFEVLD
jgi:tetratricopeptide (TPR) repeat protein